MPILYFFIKERARGAFLSSDWIRLKIVDENSAILKLRNLFRNPVIIVMYPDKLHFIGILETNPLWMIQWFPHIQMVFEGILIGFRFFMSCDSSQDSRYFGSFTWPRGCGPEGMSKGKEELQGTESDAADRTIRWYEEKNGATNRGPHVSDSRKPD